MSLLMFLFIFFPYPLSLPSFSLPYMYIGHKYTLHVTTGDIAGGGTSAGVYVDMVGSGGDSGKVNKV